MALINCPECGGQISSTAKQCIHCGCKIAVCPECGSAFVEEFKICPVCGYEEKQTGGTAITAKSDSKSDTGSECKIDGITKWQNSSLADNSILKLIKYVKIGMHVLSALLVIVACIILITSSLSTDLLLKADVMKNTVTCLLIFSCVFECFDMLIDPVKEAFIKLRCGSWIRSKTDFDAVAYIRENNVFMGTLSDEEDFGIFTEATYISETQKGKGILYADLIIRIVLAIIIWTCIGVFLMQLTSQLFVIYLLFGEINWNYLFDLGFDVMYVSLIVGVVFGVIYFCVTLYTESVYSKGYTAWLNQTFPDWSENNGNK